ncbi:MAG: F0F1 ATP synthase subunit B [Desulfobacteraceae bacterium]|nr:F0F1 ATP synthase subunit B [Desulfobacteraceae bacterium]MBC2719589.1 F0F1 ATP synthase subunit B [Desulfobacteraceae bacterium]
MLIDWFTVIAQVINFLVLVYLLKRFLYGPIIRAIDERERKIALRLEEASRKKEVADLEAENYRRKNREFNERREEMFSQIKEEVEVRRKDLINEARNQVDAGRTKWYEAIQREREAFLQDLRRRAGRQTCAISRRALKDMADVDLENQIIHVFIERLLSLNRDEIKALKESIHQLPQKISVRSAFKIPGKPAGEIKKALRNQAGGHVDVQFEVSPDLICGIELKLEGSRISWNVDDYLETLEESLLAALESKAEKVADRLSDK